MKTFILIASLLLTLSAHATTGLMSYEGTYNGKPEISYGFTENGFQTPEQVCFHGKIEGVCAAVERAEAAASEQYSSGDHGYFEVTLCEVEGNQVKLNYFQRTDYGDATVAMTIISCDQAAWIK